ncbi:MAG TPA: hypothetical protein VNC78_09630 [Actinomycetota bacterium]|nr:hypothetical protein [Actinomycetota bacterium]
MTRRKIASFVTALTIAVASPALFAAPAQAAPDCRGASGIIRCTPDRISCLLRSLSLPPQDNCL